MIQSIEGHEVFRYRSLIWNFAQRELRSKYKGSALGWAWSMIMPLATLGMYSFIFGVVLRTNAPAFGNGHDAIFAVWLFGGLIAYGFFANGVMRSTESLLSSGALMKKVYFPAYAPVIGALIAVGFQSLIETSVYLVVLAAFGNVSWTWLLLPLLFLLAFCFVLGVGMAAAVAGIFYRDFGHLTSVLVQFLFFATPVMYPLSLIPHDGVAVNLRSIVAGSPLTKIVDLYRALLYDLSPGAASDWIALSLWSLASLVLGFIVVHQFGRDLGELI